MKLKKKEKQHAVINFPPKSSLTEKDKRTYAKHKYIYAVAFNIINWLANFMTVFNNFILHWASARIFSGLATVAKGTKFSLATAQRL